MRKVLAVCLTMLASASAFQLCGNAVTGRSTASEPILRSSHSRSAVWCMQTESAGSSKGKLLVLGGTGFVGATVAKLALDRGYDVVSLSRRGQPSADSKLAGLTQVFLLAAIVRESLYSCGACTGKVRSECICSCRLRGSKATPPRLKMFKGLWLQEASPVSCTLSVWCTHSLSLAHSL